MMQMIQESTSKGNAHYVYGLCRGDSLELFYIGKGVKGRVFDHEKKASLNSSDNPHKNAIIKKHGVGGYVFFNSNQTAKDANDVERDLIAQYGLSNLANIGRGGEGQDPEFAREFAKKQWADPDSKIRKAITSEEYKKIQSEAQKISQARPEVRAKRRESMAKVMPQIKAKLVERFKDPEARKAAGNGSRGRVQPESERAQRSVAVKAGWANDDLRKSQSDLLKKISSTPEMREKRKLAAQAMWAKPGAKEKHAQRLAARKLDPVLSKKLSDASKARWQDPAYREKCLKNLKRKPIC